MMKQVIKMAWSRKQTYIGIWIEQMFVFIILSFCLIATIELLSKVYTPGLLDTDDVVAVIVPVDPSNAELEQKAHSLETIIKQSPHVVSLSKSINFVPYISTNDQYDSLHIDHKMVGVKLKYTDENAYKVFQPELAEGTWLTEDARPDGSYSAVITKQLADQLGWVTSLGKRITYMQYSYTIVGVMEGLKEQIFVDSPASLVLPVNTAATDTKSFLYAIKLKSGETDPFNLFYIKEFSRLYPELEDAKDDLLTCISLDKIKNAGLYGINISIAAMTLVCFFVILYTFIGSYGLISLNSEKRISEYALQRALGLTKRSLLYRVLLENLIVTLFSTIPGIIIMLVILFSYSIKMPIIISLAASLLFMILFSLFSAWFPAFKVSKMDPAEVLKNDL